MSAASPHQYSRVKALKESVRPEIQLLLLCARLQLQAAERDRMIALIQYGLDWRQVLALGGEHGLLPLLYRHLNSNCPDLIPKEIFVELWGRYESNLRHNLKMQAELAGILECLEANGVAALPYKGPALAEGVYGDVGLREFGDLDILLRFQDVLEAKKLLQTIGYLPSYDLKPAQEAAFMRSSMQYHLNMIHLEKSILVELHWKSDMDFPVEPEGNREWWATRPRYRLGDLQVRAFTEEELLLVLLIHGTKHGWSSLGWLVDVAEMIRQKPGLDWDWVVSRAIQLGCERRMDVGLHLAAQLLNAPIPESIQARSDKRVYAKEISLRVFESIFGAEAGKQTYFEQLRLRLDLLHEDGWKRAGFLLKMALAPTVNEWLRWPLPRVLSFLYLPLRVFRLIGKYGTAMFARKR